VIAQIEVHDGVAMIEQGPRQLQPLHVRMRSVVAAAVDHDDRRLRVVRRHPPRAQRQRLVLRMELNRLEDDAVVLRRTHQRRMRESEPCGRDAKPQQAESDQQPRTDYDPLHAAD